jgi:hypothetical protein
MTKPVTGHQQLDTSQQFRYFYRYLNQVYAGKTGIALHCKEKHVGSVTGGFSGCWYGDLMTSWYLFRFVNLNIAGCWLLVEKTLTGLPIILTGLPPT